ncbi:MAG: gas vesicle protein [Actinobacteria bacterium]|nr:MAG: gas vesicle protein [Actinomycetota bacterium]
MTDRRTQLAAQRDVALVDLVDRLLAGGVVIVGDVTLSLADIDLVHLSLQLVVGSVPTLAGEAATEAGDDLRLRAV